MNKKNLTLLIILAALLGMSAVYQYLWLPKNTNSAQQDNFLAKVNFSEVDKMVIKRNGQETVLNKEGERWRVVGDGEWYINNILADTFNQAWQTVATSSMFVVSKNKDTKVDFKTDGSFGLKLSAKNNQLMDLAVGSGRAGYTYVALNDADTSYEVRGDLRGAFDYEEWRDLNIFNAVADKINQIKLTQGKNSLVINKNNNSWQLAGDTKTKLNQDKIKRIVSLMAELSANSIPNQKVTNTGLDKKNWVVEATGEGVKNVLIIGQEEILDKKLTGNFFVKNAVSPNIYLLGENLTGVFQVKLKDLTN